ncbi:MAG: DUF4440 domain-containing protein, partial [Saprospiraceae bacterium]
MKTRQLFNAMLVMFALVSISLTSCKQAAETETAEAAPEVDANALKADIQALENGFAAGMNAGDADAVVAYYSDDAMSLDNNGPMLSGKDAIKASIVKNIADSGKNKTSFETVDIKVSGDLLVEVGKSTT